MSLKYKSHWKHSQKIRSSSSDSIAGGQELHARKEKRLQITDPEPIQVPRSDAPKTSEFAYFKKFKKELGGSSSRSLNRRDNLKTSHVNELDFESTISAKRFADLRRNIKTSFQAEIQEPDDQSPFLSPSRIDVDNYILENRKGKPHEVKHVCLCVSGNTSKGSQDVFASPFASTSTKDSGNLSAEDGIFSTKRKKLRQCVAESFKDVEGLNVNSKGFDMISTLLNRLFPPEDESKFYGHSKSKEYVIGADDHPPSFHEPYTLDKSSTLFASTSQTDSLWSDFLPAHSFGRPWDMMIPSGFYETKYDMENNLLDYEDHENTVNILCAENDSSFTQSYKKLHSNGLCLREHDDFHDPDEPSRNKPCNLFLSLDDEDNKENSYTTMDESFLPQLPLWSGHCLEHLDFRLKDTYIHQPWKIHEDNYAIEVAEQFHQHIPSPPRYLTWEEEDLNECDDFSYRQTDPSCVFDTACFSRGLNTTYLGLECLPVIDLFSNYPSNNRIFTLPWKEDCIPFDSNNKETCLNYLDKCLPSPDHDFDSLDRSQANFDSIVGEVMGKPLLLDYYPYRVSYEGEYCLDDDNS